ncbi:MAG TPA: hypothetical protein VKB59_18135 [Micromonosporaceae bacterium]|nr:hypothetical protein [Micromonosporaceae bacterium]
MASSVVAATFAGFASGCAASGDASATGPALAASTSGAVPAEFRAACGHPGKTVVVQRVPVTVRHADCDLTGVTVRYGHASADVPTPGLTAAATVDLVAPDGQPTEIQVATDADTLDVTVTG